MRNKKLTHQATAEKVIQILGGPAKMAEFLRVHRSVPYRWLTPKKDGGIGCIPMQHQQTLLNSELGITPDDFWHIEGEPHGTKEKG